MTSTQPLSGLALLLGMAALSLAGCAVTNQLVREQAVLDLACPAEQLAITYVKNGAFLVSGCDQRAAYRCVSSAFGETRCGRVDHRQLPALPPAQREQRIRDKAATVLACDPVSLALTSDLPGYYTAEGCGRTVDYECVSRPEDCCVFETPGARTLEVAKRDDIPEPESDGAKGSLSKEGIREVMQTSGPTVRKCYEAALDKAPFVTGSVWIKFIIAPNGHVQTAALARSSLARPQAESCIIHAIRDLEFDKPKGGGIVVVTYPYVFETTPPHAACR